MPEFPLRIPMVGNSWAVGLAFQVHIAIVAFIMGIALIAPVAEMLGLRRGDERLDRLARTLATTIGRLFSFGATWAVLALVLLYGLYPRLFGVLTARFYWPLVVVSVLWLVMTVSAYVYYHTWDHFRERRRLHIAIGWTFAGSSFLFISLIILLSSYMLTPDRLGGVLSGAVNASWPAELIHRHIGNLSYAGLLLASYAGVRVLFFSDRAGEDTAYYGWLGRLGLLLGLGLALLQPIGGWFYAHQIQVASPDAFHRMMVGEYARLWLVQSFLFAAVLFLGNIYLTRSVRLRSLNRRAARWARRSLWVIAALGLLLVVPKELPLGQMRPWKYISLAGLVLLSLVNLYVYLKLPRRWSQEGTAWGQRLVLALIGVTIVALLVTMGIIRSLARGPDLIHNRLGPVQGQELERP